MPVYEYRCTGCQHVFDRHQAVGEAAPECPECGSPSRKVFRSVGLIFKGSGFHTTDYRKSAGNGEKPASGADSAPDGSSTPSPASSSQGGKSGSAPSGSGASSKSSTP